MCLVLFAVGAHPEYPLVVAANRDEFYRRPALPVHHWDEDPRVVAGRDLEADGTWLGISAAGRFAAVTNYSDLVDSAPLSRGALTASFLTGDMTAEDYASSIHGPSYRGFNLLLWDGYHMVYVSNKAPMQRLRPGTYGLSNAALGSEWPKVLRGRSVLQSVLRQTPTSQKLLNLLNDDSVPPDHELPDRGRPLEMERRIAPCFIRGDEYGTRASSSVIFTHEHVSIAEQLYGPGGTPGDHRELVLPWSR